MGPPDRFKIWETVFLRAYGQNCTKKVCKTTEKWESKIGVLLYLYVPVLVPTQMLNETYKLR